MTLFAAYFFFTSCFGRRISMIILQFCMTLLCLALGILAINDHGESVLVYIIAILAMITKAFAASSIFGMSLQAIEVFPTTLRSSAGGVVSVVGSIGCLTAPQIILSVKTFI